MNFHNSLQIFVFFNLTWKKKLVYYIFFDLKQNEICNFFHIGIKSITILKQEEVGLGIVGLFIPYQNHKICLSGKADRRNKKV